jgi:hypothetical protein
MEVVREVRASYVHTVAWIPECSGVEPPGGGGP